MALCRDLIERMVSPPSFIYSDGYVLVPDGTVLFRVDGPISVDVPTAEAQPISLIELLEGGADNEQ